MTDFNDIYTEQGATAVKSAINNAQPVARNAEQIIQEAASMSDIELEINSKTLAQEANIRLPAFRSFVKKEKAKQNPPDSENTNMFPATPVHEYPVNGTELLDEMYALLNRFIVCSHETAVATTLWIAFTWFVHVVQVAPIAMITAPEMQCGKTQLLSFIGKLVNRALLASNISPSAIFRVIESCAPTLLIDEADSFLRENEEARGVLNSGHTRQSAFVIRNVGDEHTPTQFSTWGAKVLCGIGKLAATLMSRSIVLELRRKLPHEKVERLRHADEAAFESIKSKLARFQMDYADTIKNARPDIPEILNDRAQDNWEPLLAIADCAGDHWPTTARNAAIKLSQRANSDEQSSAGTMLLADIRDIFDDLNGTPRISTKALLHNLTEMNDRPWPEWYRGKPITARQLAKHLKPFGIAPKKLRFSHSITERGYELSQFSDAFARYLDGTAEQHNDFS